MRQSARFFNPLLLTLALAGCDGVGEEPEDDLAPPPRIKQAQTPVPDICSHISPEQCEQALHAYHYNVSSGWCTGGDRGRWAVVTLETPVLMGDRLGTGFGAGDKVKLAQYIPDDASARDIEPVLHLYHNGAHVASADQGGYRAYLASTSRRTQLVGAVATSPSAISSMYDQMEKCSPVKTSTTIASGSSFGCALCWTWAGITGTTVGVASVVLPGTARALRSIAGAPQLAGTGIAAFGSLGMSAIVDGCKFLCNVYACRAQLEQCQFLEESGIKPMPGRGGKTCGDHYCDCTDIAASTRGNSPWNPRDDGYRRDFECDTIR